MPPVRFRAASGSEDRPLRHPLLGGFPPDKAEHLLVRADLMIRLEKELGSRGLKQAHAAKLLGITQPRVSNLLRGRIELFSADALIDMLARLGIKVRLVASTRRRVA